MREEYIDRKYEPGVIRGLGRMAVSSPGSLDLVSRHRLTASPGTTSKFSLRALGFGILPMPRLCVHSCARMVSLFGDGTGGCRRGLAATFRRASRSDSRVEWRSPRTSTQPNRPSRRRSTQPGRCSGPTRARCRAWKHAQHFAASTTTVSETATPHGFACVFQCPVRRGVSGVSVRYSSLSRCAGRHLRRGAHDVSLVKIPGPFASGRQSRRAILRSDMKDWPVAGCDRNLR